jgi:hypothetical protein
VFNSSTMCSYSVGLGSWEVTKSAASIHVLTIKSGYVLLVGRGMDLSILSHIWPRSGVFAGMAENRKVRLNMFCQSEKVPCPNLHDFVDGGPRFCHSYRHLSEGTYESKE